MALIQTSQTFVDGGTKQQIHYWPWAIRKLVYPRVSETQNSIQSAISSNQAAISCVKTNEGSGPPAPGRYRVCVCVCVCVLFP
ncbi:unnamed protein product [Penicillium roqueforti FM164]|uniref:Genomic scaffold, ProqFM164S02 n=1 Tax=Penicillium roqueforti (strain FM164) TaxID=1365484 RepID=W6Q6V9_PENRF|nr:unnamed protein product [Penicillium roqueforti FM164]